MNVVATLNTHSALTLRDVSKIFGSSALRAPWHAKSTARRVVAVDNVSLDVGRGEIFGVLGANGSGKSTLIRLVSTLLLPDGGTMEIFGLDVVKHELRVKQLINRVSVDAAFFKKLSPMENLLYAARLYGLGSHETQGRGIEILESLGISKKVAVAPMEHMSRGMQQKVAIARALLTSPGAVAA